LGGLKDDTRKEGGMASGDLKGGSPRKGAKEGTKVSLKVVRNQNKGGGTTHWGTHGKKPALIRGTVWWGPILPTARV